MTASAVNGPRNSPALEQDIEVAAHVLPVQGPIGTFVHHNTLHAFQHLPFHEAIKQATAKFETHAYLPESDYRKSLASGRIRREDVLRAFEPRRARDDASVRVGEVSRADLECATLLGGIELLSPAEVAWEAAECGVLDRLRKHLPHGQRAALVARSVSWLRRTAKSPLVEELFGSDGATSAIERALADDAERVAARSLYEACRHRTRDLPTSPCAKADGTRSHRDLLFDLTGFDTARLVNPIMARLSAAFLDLGFAQWSLPGRSRGFFSAVVELMSVGAPTEPWLHELPGILEGWSDGTSALDAVRSILDELAPPDAGRVGYLERVLLELPGWAGMFNRVAHDPILAAEFPAPVSLVDYLAVRLAYTRCALAWALDERLGVRGPLKEACATLVERARTSVTDEANAARTSSGPDAAFTLWQVAQGVGWAVPDVWELDSASIRTVFEWLDEFDDLERRRIWHEAYELHHENEILSAIVDNLRDRRQTEKRAPPEFQVAFCIDEREESLRRHVEELGPRYETFGVAGFFGLAIEWQGLDDASPMALCPVAVRPAHRVHEHPEEEHRHLVERRRRRRARHGRVVEFFARGTRGVVRATVLTLLVGAASIGPMILRVLFPRAAERLRVWTLSRVFPQPDTRLTALRDAEPEGEQKPIGFTLDEKVDRLEATLRSIGLTSDFAPMVVLLGHGSVSLNNPHESAHDCGACGGKHGGPNARLFAEAANRPDVRARLSERGIVIPEGTVFVGGQHNTCDESIVLFDEGRVPPSHRSWLAQLKKDFDRARTFTAHERCRRFESAALGISPRAALHHVEARAADLSQVRPEWGHATNAVCVVGRRSMTYGLFLDRRAFLVSYNPSQDPDGGILELVLAAVGPVGAGINLEYYFSRVDNDRYGCGTKLPHNVTGLIGVMDGHLSDLRTGLPWQMVEIHEPVRLLLVVESTPEILLSIAGRQKEVGELVANEWIRVVTVDPNTRSVHAYRPGKGFVPVTHFDTPVPRVASSRAWYAGCRDFLPPAIIDPTLGQRQRQRTQQSKLERREYA
jgi:uncharacterized protein YbcC (UPF0753/DUF2309 family)